jgi:hypothetical protein
VIATELVNLSLRPGGDVGVLLVERFLELGKRVHVPVLLLQTGTKIGHAITTTTTAISTTTAAIATTATSAIASTTTAAVAAAAAAAAGITIRAAVVGTRSVIDDLKVFKD